MRLSLLKSLVLSSVAFLWIFASGLALSFVPKVTWLSSPKIEPNSYTGVGLSQRLLEIFHKWDAKIYTGNLRGLLTGKNEYGLFFLMVSSIFVPLWFGSSTASIYRIILLGVPALLLPVTFVCKQPRWVRIFSLLLLILLNLHATYRYVASLYLA
jgi:hypothetical protein